jgi:hypothetical protein
VATEQQLGGDEWRLYDFIARNFIASLSADCRYAAKTLEFAGGDVEVFSTSGRQARPAIERASVDRDLRAVKSGCIVSNISSSPVHVREPALMATYEPLRAHPTDW